MLHLRGTEVRFYSSFTQLVRDNQFSALGLALVAELAKIREIISSYADVEGESEDDPAETRAAETLFAARTEDFGEAVGRSITEDSIVHGPTISATSKPSSGSTKAGILQRFPSGHVDGSNFLDATDEAQIPRVR